MDKNNSKNNLYSIKTTQRTGWLAHLSRHTPPNTRVKYAVGLSPTGSIIRN